MSAQPLRLPIIDGLFGCVALHCVLSPDACAARHIARVEARRGVQFRSPLYPTCAECPLGAINAGASPAAPKKTLGPRPPCEKCSGRFAGKVVGGGRRNATPKGQEGWCAPCRAAARRPALQVRPPCSKCRARVAGWVRLGTKRATPKGQEGWCSPCRAVDRAQRRSETKAPAPPKLPPPPCEKCGLRPRGVKYPATPKEQEGWCGTCRNVERHAQDYRFKREMRGGSRVSQNICAGCWSAHVGRVRSDTRPDHVDLCGACRQLHRQRDLLRAKRHEAAARAA